MSTQTQSRSSISAAERLEDRDVRAGGGVPIDASAAAATPVGAPAPRRRTPLLAVVIVAALALIGAGVRQWWMNRFVVSTDNAQVEGRVVPVLPRVTGYVAGVPVKENQTVPAGGTLVIIDDRDLRARLAQTEADLAKEIANAGTRGNPGQAAAQLEAARAAVAQAEANAARARADLARARPLAERNIVSRQQLDAAVAVAAASEAQLAAARDQVAADQAALTGAGAKVAAARAARDQAALQLSYATVAAPLAGVVSRKSVEVGQMVQVGQPLMSVVPLEDVWIVANLKETEIRDVTPGDRADIEVDSYPGRTFKGHVESLSPTTGARFSLLPPDNATGNFTKVVQRIPVRVRLDRAENPVHPLRPGMSVRVRIRTK